MTENEGQQIVETFVGDLARWADGIKFAPYVKAKRSGEAIYYVTIDGDIEASALAKIIVNAAKAYYGAGNVEPD